MTNNNKISKKKKKTPFNAVDVLIILFIALCLAYIVYVLILGNSLYNIGAKRVNIEYEIEIAGNDISIQNNQKFQVGDKVRSADGSHELGTIKEKYTNADGSVSVVISSEAFLRKEIYKIGDIRIYKDATLSIRFPDYAPSDTVKCIDVKVV